MTVTANFYAGAAEAAGTASAVVDQPTGTTVESFTATLAGDDPELIRILGRCSVLLDGQRISDPAGAVLRDGSSVDYLPPFAGG